MSNTQTPKTKAPTNLLSSRRDVACVLFGLGMGINVGIILEYFFHQPSDTMAFPHPLILVLIMGVLSGGIYFLNRSRDH